MEDYIKCELSGRSPSHLNTFPVLFIVAVLYTNINTCYVLLLLLSVPMYTMLSTTKQSEKNIAYLVANVGCTHIGSATTSFKDLVTLYRRTLQQISWYRISYGLLQGLSNIVQKNTTADILVEDQLWPPSRT